MQGVIVAFIAEFVIAFVLMSVVLRVSNTPHLARYTGLFAGCTGRHLHHAGSAAFGHEHESGAHIRLRVCRSSLDRRSGFTSPRLSLRCNSQRLFISAARAQFIARNIIITIDTAASLIAAFLNCCEREAVAGGVDAGTIWNT